MVTSNTSTFGIDRAVPLSSSNLTSLKKHENGKYANFALRYLAPSGSWKALTLDEVNRLKAYGFQIGSIFQEGKDGTLQGFKGGVAAATKALERAKGLGQPQGSPIFFAVDYDAPASDHNSIEQFLKGVKVTFASYYTVGIYGKFDVIEEMHRRNACDYYWQTYAWSRGKLSNAADLYQYKNDVMASSVVVDFNECFNDKVFWNPRKVEKPIKEEPKTDNVTMVAKWEYDALAKKVFDMGKRLESIEKQITTNFEESKAPDWFTTEFGDVSKYVNNVKGNSTFWRNFAVTLRIFNKKS